MAKRSIKMMRQAELSQAALETLVEYGIRGATIDRVATRAGVSKGIVLHHFADKDALFEAVMRRANTLLRDGVVELLHHAETPVERLCSVIVGNFAEPVFHQEICHAWISLCADVPYNKQSQRIQTVIHARMRSNLLSALRPLVSEQEVDAMTFHIGSIIDGVWLRASMQEKPMTSREGIDYVNDAVVRFLFQDVAAKLGFLEASGKMEALAEIILKSKAFTDKMRNFG